MPKGKPAMYEMQSKIMEMLFKMPYQPTKLHKKLCQNKVNKLKKIKKGKRLNLPHPPIIVFNLSDQFALQNSVGLLWNFSKICSVKHYYSEVCFCSKFSGYEVPKS